jgi:hypothetical protein
MSFVNLPVEGDPVARLPEVLDQIHAASAEDYARTVRRIGNRIEFSTDSLLRRWLFRDRFLVSSGEIEGEASSDSLMIDYRLSFFEFFVLMVVMFAVYAIVIVSHSPVASARFNVYLLLFALVLFFGVGMVRAVFEFSRFLRQFPREDS